VQPGRAIVTVYRRKTPPGNFAFMVAAQKPVKWKANGLRHSYASYEHKLTTLQGTGYTQTICYSLCSPQCTVG
jgi:hypothetical protein